MSNNIIDPYYDWPLSQEQFNKYIISKYGSVIKAQEIAFYRNNYNQDDTLLSPSSYNSLIKSSKKYYSPVIGYNNSVISYQRKQSDVVLETNKIISLTVTSNTGFLVGEKITQNSNSGYITHIGNTHITISKITGSITNNQITGSSSGSTANVTNTTLLNQPIPDAEGVFYSPVTFIEYEEELNESKFNIRILDRSYIGKIQKDMRELFR